MADRRPSFSFRFWSAPALRRARATPISSPPPATTTSAPTTTPAAESQAVSQAAASTTKPTSTTTPPTAETQAPGSQSTTIAVSPTKERQIADQPPTTAPDSTKTPSSKDQMSSQLTTNTFTSPADEPKTSSPSNSTTQSPSSSKPASPSRRTAQSRTPPQPSSPSRAAPQARSTPLSPSRMGSQTSKTPSTPQRASQPRSPSRLASRPPKQSSTSPSKESRQTTQEISSSNEAPTLASNEKDPKAAASQQEPQLKAEVKSDSANDFNVQTVDGTTSKQDEVEIMPSKSSKLGTTTTHAQGPETTTPAQKLDFSTINGGHETRIELNATPEETKDVKEVVKATKTEAHEETKKEETKDVKNAVQATKTEANEETKKDVKEVVKATKTEAHEETKKEETKDVKKEVQATKTEANEGTKKDVKEVVKAAKTEANEETEKEETKDVKEVVQATKTEANEETEKEETKDVKEVVQATKTEANEETKKEVNDFLTPKSGSEAKINEKAEIPSKPDQMHTEKQEALDTKGILATSLPSVKPTNTPNSQPKKRSTISGTHNKTALPIGEHVSLNKDIRDDISTFVNQMAIGDPKSAIYDRPVNVITLAGENRGASMQMGSNSSIREGPVHIHRSYKINPDESAEVTTDGDGSFEGKQSEDAKASEDQPTERYVNSNAQGINNSIVFNASITEGNPGVHMVFSHVPKEPIQPTDKTNPLETRKAEVNMSRPEKLTYEPTVRRRCLRGLFLETSDSDHENPEKPRRHGCRVGCQKRDEENDIDVL